MDPYDIIKEVERVVQEERTREDWLKKSVTPVQEVKRNNLNGRLVMLIMMMMFVFYWLMELGRRKSMEDTCQELDGWELRLDQMFTKEIIR